MWAAIRCWYGYVKKKRHPLASLSREKSCLVLYITPTKKYIRRAHSMDNNSNDDNGDNYISFFRPRLMTTWHATSNFPDRSLKVEFKHVAAFIEAGQFGNLWPLTLPHLARGLAKLALQPLSLSPLGTFRRHLKTLRKEKFEVMAKRVCVNYTKGFDFLLTFFSLEIFCWRA